MSMSVLAVAFCAISTTLVGCAHVLPFPEHPHEAPPSQESFSDCDGDGVDDFIVGSPDFSIDKQLGRVVVYSGRTLDPILRIDGTEPYQCLGLDCAFVPDLDGDGCAEIACVSRTCHGVVGACRIDVFSGKTQAVLRTIDCDSLLDRNYVRIAVVPPISEQGRGTLLVGCAGVGGGCGAVSYYSLEPFVMYREAFGDSGDHFGTVLASLRPNVISPTITVTAIGAMRRSMSQQITFASSDGENKVVEVGGGFSAPAVVARRIVRLPDSAMNRVAICGIPSKVSGADAVGRVLAVDCKSGRIHPDVIEGAGDTGFASSVATCVDREGLLRGVFVGAPELEGCVWFYARLSSLPGKEINSKTFTSYFGQTLVELSDVNGDGITDVAVVGLANYCDGERGFAVLSGADGALLRVWAPLSRASAPR